MVAHRLGYGGKGAEKGKPSLLSKESTWDFLLGQKTSAKLRIEKGRALLSS